MFANGHYEGEGLTVWDNGSFERGIYKDDELMPLDMSVNPDIYKDPDEYIGYYAVLVGHISELYMYEDELIGFYLDTDINYSDEVNTFFYWFDPDTVAVGDYVEVTGRVYYCGDYEDDAGNVSTDLEFLGADVQKIS